MARINVDLDGHLIRESNKAGADRGITLERLVEDALREALAPAMPAVDYALSWVPIHGDALPDVDIADRGALYDRVEDRLSR